MVLFGGCPGFHAALHQGAEPEPGGHRLLHPRTHEPLFKQTVKEAGLNPYLLEFVSIREQVSWVHMKEPDAATRKAKDLVKMGVAKAALLEEGEEIRLPVGKECMIIGGGMAGMNAALSVARQGFQAIIVEKQPELGGLLNRITTISHEHGEVPAAEIVQRMKALVGAEPNIRSTPMRRSKRSRATSGTTR